MISVKNQTATCLPTMKNRSSAFAVAGVSIGIFGLSLSFIGISYQLAQNSTNFGPYPVFGALLAAVGMVISILAAVTSSDRPA
jgi:hypothetical protein